MKLGRMLQKQPLRDVVERSGSWDGTYQGTDDFTVTSGIITGNKVATGRGWCDVNALVPGDRVLTFDNGLQVLRGVTRSWVGLNHSAPVAERHVLNVPKGVLGNKTQMQLMPDQPVMVESDLGDEFFGDPFTLIPAHSLEGYNGIERVEVVIPVQVSALHFDEEQVVFAHVGALFHCPVQEDLIGGGLMKPRDLTDYDVLSDDEADAFIGVLKRNQFMEHQAMDATWTCAAANS